MDKLIIGILKSIIVNIPIEDSNSEIVKDLKALIEKYSEGSKSNIDEVSALVDISEVTTSRVTQDPISLDNMGDTLLKNDIIKGDSSKEIPSQEVITEEQSAFIEKVTKDLKNKNFGTGLESIQELINQSNQVISQNQDFIKAVKQVEEEQEIEDLSNQVRSFSNSISTNSDNN